MNLLTQLQRFVVDEDGPTAIEYAIMLSLIVVACITVVTTIGTTLSSQFSTVNSASSGS